MNLTYRYNWTLLGLVLACGPSSGSTDGASTTDDASTTDTTASTDPTTTDPTPTEPTGADTTDTGTTDGATTEGPAAVGCQRIAGDGEVEWALRCGGPADERFSGVAVDAAGDIYVGIDLRSVEPSVPLQFGAFEVLPGGETDILIVKLDPAGEVVWVRHFSGPEDQYLLGLWGCGDGVAIRGMAPAGTLDLGGGVLADAEFIAVFDGDGAHRWSRSVPILVDDGHLMVTEIACDAAGSAALTGWYRGGIDLGGGPIMAAELEDGIVARFDASGALQWSRGFGNTNGSAYGRGVAFTPDGEVALVGFFNRTVDLGAGPLNADNSDVLVALLGVDGTAIWSEQIGPAGLQYGFAIAVDAAGQVAVGGTFLDGIEIGADSYINVFPDAIDEFDGTLYDGFLAFLDDAGTPSSSLQIGTEFDDDVYQLRFDAEGALVMTGFTDEAFTVRAHVDGVPGWQWSTDQPLVNASTALADGAVIVAASARQLIDLGDGVLAPHGEEDDVVVAKIRR